MKLPAIHKQSTTILADITTALGIPRDVLASDEEIVHALAGLPRLLNKIPESKRDSLLARLCVAVAAGLFDSAINYAWNAAVLELRAKVRQFGLPIVPQLIGKPFDEKLLLDLKDAELLSLLLSLNLIGEEAYFFLDQCRDIRNNFSAAHPAIGDLDDHEVLQFLNRCAKYALSDTSNPKGVDTSAFLAALKSGRFAKAQQDKWIELLEGTHDAQRDLLLLTVHGIYCDPDASGEARNNALAISKYFAAKLGPTARSQLLNRHTEYLALGKDSRLTASQDFFGKIGLISLLSDSERHGIVSRASERLLSVHKEFNNFYNEPPFAERLQELTSQGAVPESAKFEFVCTVLACAVGNQYGVSWAALPHYEKMIRDFSPKEVAIMLEAAENYPTLAFRLKHYSQCRKRFGELVASIEKSSVPATHLSLYKKLIELDVA